VKLEAMIKSKPTLEFLLKRWQASKIEPGDTVLLHSDVVRTLLVLRRRHLESHPEIVLESFLELLREGTLLLPAFNFQFTTGATFDIRNSVSEMGLLTEVARQDSRAVRSGHPIYSFSAFGKNKGLFQGLENHSGYGPDSPFAILRELDGKIAVLDIPDERCMTFIHHVEEMHTAPYRYHKEFTGPYIDASGRSMIRSFSLFVRNLERGVETDVKPLGDRLSLEGAYTGDPPLIDSGFRAIRAKALYNYTSKIINDEEAEGMLYKSSESTQ
jgi:aminoglycoside 3-N-acetyltransferase